MLRQLRPGPLRLKEPGEPLGTAGSGQSSATVFGRGRLRFESCVQGSWVQIERQEIWLGDKNFFTLRVVRR